MSTKSIPIALQAAGRIAQVASNTVAQTMPKGFYQSPPLPTRIDDDVAFIFLFGRGEAVDALQKYQVWPPSYAASFSATSGQFLELISITPEDFELTDKPDVPLGPGVAPAAMQQADMMNAIVQYYECTDALLPGFYEALPISPDYYQAARQWNDRLAATGATCLARYYKCISTTFLRWIRIEA